MQHEEYTVIPAPFRGEKTREARNGAERFAHALTVEINRMAASGWEYIRAETLPCEERSGLTSRTTVYHNVLVFRRRLTPAAVAPQQEPAARTAPVSSEATVGAGTVSSGKPAAPDRDPEPAPDAAENPGPAPAFVQRPPLAARPDPETAPEPANGNRLGPAAR